MKLRKNDGRRKWSNPIWHDGEPTGEKPFADRMKLERATEKYLTLLFAELLKSYKESEDG